MILFFDSRHLTANFMTCLKNGNKIIINYKDVSMCSVHSPTNVHFYFKKRIKIYIKININFAPTCFGLRPPSGSLH